MTRSVFLVLCLLIFNGIDVCLSQNTGTIHFKTSMETVDESDYYNIQLVAQRTFDQKITVNLTFTDGTAKYLVDYYFNPLITPSVTFSPGSMSSSVFRVVTVANNIWEGAKWFEVGFDPPSGQNLNSGKPGTLRVNIADDDSVHISFQNSTRTVREDLGKLPLQLQSHGPYGRRFSVSITCIPVFPTEAKDGDDFTGGVYTVQFGDLRKQSTSTTVEIPIRNDFIQESTEHFTCVILRPREDGIIADCPRTIDIEIEDDDAIGVSFEKSEYFGEEGSILSIRLKATRTQIPFSVQIVTIPLDSSKREKKCEATSGVDYTNPRSLLEGGVVLFNPNLGLISSEVSIPLLPDNIAEGTEYFGLNFVQIITDGDNPILITPVDPVQAIVAIEDTNAPFVQFVDASVAGVEGDVVSLIVNRSRTITRRLKCKVSTESTTAIAGDDYRLFTSSIDFKRQNAAFEVKTIYLQLLEDNLSERKECFRVVLDCRPKDLTGCYPPSATVCIQGN